MPSRKVLVKVKFSPFKSFILKNHSPAFNLLRQTVNLLNVAAKGIILSAQLKPLVSNLC